MASNGTNPNRCTGSTESSYQAPVACPSVCQINANDAAATPRIPNNLGDNSIRRASHQVGGARSNGAAKNIFASNNTNPMVIAVMYDRIPRYASTDSFMPVSVPKTPPSVAESLCNTRSFSRTQVCELTKIRSCIQRLYFSYGRR